VWADITVFEPLSLKSSLQKILLLAYRCNTRTAHFGYSEPLVIKKPVSWIISLRFQVVKSSAQRIAICPVAPIRGKNSTSLIKKS